MITYKQLRFISTTVICLVWAINGLLCKILNLVPRHKEIVSAILGEDYAAYFTMAIGFAEVLMVVWILSRIRSRLCSLFQMAIVAVMNIMEFILIPELLLFGRMNMVFALMFIGLIYVNEFVFGKYRRVYAID